MRMRMEKNNAAFEDAKTIYINAMINDTYLEVKIPYEIRITELGTSLKDGVPRGNVTSRRLLDLFPGSRCLILARVWDKVRHYSLPS